MYHCMNLATAHVGTGLLLDVMAEMFIRRPDDLLAAFVQMLNDLEPMLDVPSSRLVP